MNRDEFAVLLGRYIKTAGSQVKAADQLEISPSYLCDLLKGRREPGSKILTALSLRRVVEYEKSA